METPLAIKYYDIQNISLKIFIFVLGGAHWRHLLGVALMETIAQSWAFINSRALRFLHSTLKNKPIKDGGSTAGLSQRNKPKDQK